MGTILRRRRLLVQSPFIQKSIENRANKNTLEIYQRNFEAKKNKTIREPALGVVAFD